MASSTNVNENKTVQCATLRKDLSIHFIEEAGNVLDARDMVSDLKGLELGERTKFINVQFK